LLGVASKKCWEVGSPKNPTYAPGPH